MSKTKDYIFSTTINKLFTQEEIDEIIYFLELSDISKFQEEKVEMFFIKLNNHVKDWAQTLLNFCGLYDLEIDLILSQSNLIKRIKEEVKHTDNKLTEFFS